MSRKAGGRTNEDTMGHSAKPKKVKKTFDFKIENGIKIPENRGRSFIYPWNDLKKGQSFNE